MNNQNMNGIFIFKDDESFLEMMELLKMEYEKKERKVVNNNPNHI